MMAGPGESSEIVYSALKRMHGPFPVIMEPREDRILFIQRRLRRLGWAKTVGQIAFMSTVVPFLRRVSKARIENIKNTYCLNSEPIRSDVFFVDSVNSTVAGKIVSEQQPRVIVINGTRILRQDLISLANVPIINMHAGITPRYRGVHGGYWARVENLPEQIGTTVHLVDSGIDTGRIISQACFSPAPRDNFATYPYLHLAAGLPLLLSAVQAALDGNLTTVAPPHNSVSALRTHPTLWDYILTGLRLGAW